MLLGTPQGRWHAELTRTSRSLGEATLLLCAANDVSVLPDAVVDTPVTFGMAVMISWRFVHGTPTHEQTEAMLLVAQAAHPRPRCKGHKRIGHSFLASMSFPSQLEQPALPVQRAHMPAQLLGRILLEGMARVTGGESQRTV